MLSYRLKEYRKEHSKDDEFSPVHLNYKTIKVIDHIPSRFIYIEQLYLNHNHLSTLAGIESFLNLKIFHVRFNHLCDLNELKRIKNPFFLCSLATLGNPMESDQNCKYRSLKQNFFKNLTEYNPSSAAYYRLRDQTPPLITHVTHKTPSKCAPPIHIIPNQHSTNRKSHKNADLSLSFIGRKGTTSPRGSGENYQRVKEVSFEMKTNIPKLEETQRFQRSSFFHNSRDDQNQAKRPRQQMKEIRPFEEDSEQSQKGQPSAQTAKFSFKNRLSQNRRHLTDRYVDEQTQYLADAFYFRNLYEKTMNALRGPKYEQSQRFYEAQLMLKAMTALKTNTMLCGIERDYSQKKMLLLHNSFINLKD